jgi:hypothetical protein
VTGSNGVTVKAAAAAQLVFEQQPTNVVHGQVINPPIVVLIEDQYGNVVTTNNSKVTLSIASGPGILGGTFKVNAVNGVATFSNLDNSWISSLQRAQHPRACPTHLGRSDRRTQRQEPNGCRRVGPEHAMFSVRMFDPLAGLQDGHDGRQLGLLARQTGASRILRVRSPDFSQPGK